MKTNQNNVDTPKTITHISLCAGYGGIDIGLGRAIPSLRTIAFSEIEAFACANLVSKMEAGLLDAAPIWTNLKTFPWDEFRGKVDILSGGYPCQPFSAAGKRLGEEDPRHLWPFIADGIVRMRPRICFFENVEGHISLGLSNVIEDLAGMGYRTTWGVFSASEVSAPHQRKRVFILAHCNSKRGQLSDWWRFTTEQMFISDGKAWGDELGDTKHNGLHGTKVARGNEADAGTWASKEQEMVKQCQGAGCMGGTLFPNRPGEPQHGWEPPRTTSAMGNAADQRLQRGAGKSIQGVRKRFANDDREQKVNKCRQAQPALGRDADGAAGGMGYAELQVACDNRTDELRLLGNGVVPATAERAFRVLMAELTE
jgi:DNA (cytosine-5)-methyltransferase 1